MENVKVIYQCSKCGKNYSSEKEAYECYKSHLESLDVLADVLHNKFCYFNHTDGCGYFYESWEKPGRTRNEWLEKARRVQTFSQKYNVPLSELVRLIKSL